MQICDCIFLDVFCENLDYIVVEKSKNLPANCNVCNFRRSNFVVGGHTGNYILKDNPHLQLSCEISQNRKPPSIKL